MTWRACGIQSSGGLDSVLRTLLPIRVVPGLHSSQRPSGPLGHAEIQAAPPAPSTRRALARWCGRQRAKAVCPLVPAGPTAGRPDAGSRMSEDVQVRFCERLGVKFPRATHLVILVDAHPRHAWLLKAVPKRLREELARLEVEVNEEKTRIVDLTKGERFGFLGFDFRHVRSVNGTWRPQYTPKLKKRTALLRELKVIFERSRSQPVRPVI